MLKNTNLISIFDCCREIKLKGKAPPKKNAKDKEKASSTGLSNTFYAKPDGYVAPEASISDMLSPTTKAWLGFMMANPGATYP